MKLGSPAAMAYCPFESSPPDSQADDCEMGVHKFTRAFHGFNPSCECGMWKDSEGVVREADDDGESE